MLTVQEEQVFGFLWRRMTSSGIFVMTIRFDDDASENLLNNFKASMPNE